MADGVVKSKLGNFHNFTGRGTRRLSWVLPVLALLTFIGSWVAIFPRSAVETWYARFLFPKISSVAAYFADAISISWFDVWIPALVILLVLMIRRRRFLVLLNVAAGGYLVFFWSWALNYHRQPLASKLQFESILATPEAIGKLAVRAAGEINRLYSLKQQTPHDESRIREDAVRRVARVSAVIDGSEWVASGRIKKSWLASPWMHVAGIDGVFNPFGHEPVVSNSLLDIEQPFVMAHELAHVRGYPDEGEANLVAMFATIMSDNPALQYSGWLTLWLYIRSRELDELLEEGPRRDIQRIFERARSEQIRWISYTQSLVFDWFLKANSVDEGVRSYSQVVVLAAGTQPYWDRFR
jgi:hypothetical protein